jgi:hypothetical protein
MTMAIIHMITILFVMGNFLGLVGVVVVDSIALGIVVVGAIVGNTV